ncbi:MAG: family 43 glycosylhydrolase [Christensenellales bacterium]|jgi:xylan 1,4-beta-xylosidase
MKNPVIPQNAGDPYILKDGANYYMSATGGGDRNRPGFVCWHSTDLQNWSDPVTILDFADVSWAKSKAWAPSMVEKDGYYYFAFCADQQIGIAVCDAPMGTYKDILGHPLVAKTDYDFQTIDPCFLKDDDGTVYLAFGQGKCMMSKILLSPNSAKFTGPMVCLSDGIYSQFSISPKPENKAIYNEAPDFIKIGDRYLFSWAIYDVMDYRYAMRYAWSHNPMGPYIMPLDFDHDNILLQGRHDITGCGHACVTEYRGEYYITYGRHRKNRTQGGFGREMCCEKITFLDEDHLIAIPTRSE